MVYTIYVNKPHRSIRRRCKLTSDGRYVLFEGEGNRSIIMDMARKAADHAESVNVISRSVRAITRGWAERRTPDRSGRPATTIMLDR